jgi:hypothetical protein
LSTTGSVTFADSVQGTIDMRDVGDMLDGVRLVAAADEGAALWGAADEAALQAWFTRYVDEWLITQARSC